MSQTVIFAFSIIYVCVLLLRNKNILDYRLDFAVNEIYEFFWNKFCDIYIEECKKSGNTSNLRPLLREILHVFHPFAPFITEEISNLLFKERII